jgi:hypothetical protein
MSEGQSGFFDLGMFGVFAFGTVGGLGSGGLYAGGGGGSCFISIFES